MCVLLGFKVGSVLPVNVVSLHGRRSFSGFHLLLPFSLISITYPLTGLPPSSLGLVHDSVTESASTSSTIGLPGAPGVSGDEMKTIY